MNLQTAKFTPMLLASKNQLVVRLAVTPQDVLAAQRLRYQVFYEELQAHADANLRETKLDADRFDLFCDHLLVVELSEHRPIDGTAVDDGRIVGTYRLLRQEVAQSNCGFYTQHEFDILPLLLRNPDLKFLELGRSCVAAGFRNKPVAELLWQGIWNYVRHHGIDVMLGCASLSGTDPIDLADQLTFLAHAAPAPSGWKVPALAARRVEMRLKPIEEINPKAVLRALPTLVKAYLRLGCYIGDGAVIDQQFNTTDVLIILPVSAINPRYFEHYGTALNG